MVALQKGSPYLHDVNDLLHLAKQMGLIDAGYYNYMPNATKCNTLNDIKKSHQGENQIVIVEINDIYGMLILLGLGMGGAIIIFGAEIVAMVREKTNENI